MNRVSGAQYKQKYKLLPWLVFVMLKAMIFISIGISATTRFIRRAKELGDLETNCPNLDCPADTSDTQDENRDPARELQFTVIVYIYFMAGKKSKACCGEEK